jgi:hypothetical protein
MIDPLSAAAWGSTTATSRMSFYVGRELSSALAPGMVVLAEGFLLVVCVTTERDTEGLRSLVDDLSGLQGAALVLVAVLGFSAAYVIGWVSRELGFWLVGGLEWFRRRMGRRRPSAPSEPSLSTRLRAIAGEDAVDACIAHHPVLLILDEEADDVVTRRERVRRTWGAFVPYQEDEAFSYSKSWLRRFAPEMSVDGIEADINILTAALVPLLLLVANIVAWSSEPSIAALVSVPPTVAVVTMLVRNVARKRRDERWEAVRNLVEDHIMRRALAGYPRAGGATASASGDGEVTPAGPSGGGPGEGRP